MSAFNLYTMEHIVDKYQEFSVHKLNEHTQMTTNCTYGVVVDGGVIIARIPNYIKHAKGVAEAIAIAMNKNSSNIIIPVM